MNHFVVEDLCILFFLFGLMMGMITILVGQVLSDRKIRKDQELHLKDEHERIVEKESRNWNFNFSEPWRNTYDE